MEASIHGQLVWSLIKNIMSMNYPILEFDPAQRAHIEPAHVIQPRDVPEHCVICFFKEVTERATAKYHGRLLVENRWEDGAHPLIEIELAGRRLAFIQPGVGAPLAAGLLEEVIASGCRKFIVCGGAGVLKKEITVGRLIIVTGAIRDEGVSYHYLPPGREVHANPTGVIALEAACTAHSIPYITGKTWTTDAPYRETSSLIAARRAEGCLTVEMEAAALMAVAEFRGILLGQVLYGGDDLSGEQWDKRAWQSRSEIREQLFWLAAEACLSL